MCGGLPKASKTTLNVLKFSIKYNKSFILLYKGIISDVRKSEGNITLEKLRGILLIEAEYNSVKKVLIGISLINSV